jgi:hypothetical protein
MNEKPKSILPEYLSEGEKVEVGKFVDNKKLFEAVKKVILMGIYHNGTLQEDKPADPLVNALLPNLAHMPAFTDEQLGQTLRAKAQSIAMLENSLTAMEAFKSVKSPIQGDGINEAS